MLDQQWHVIILKTFKSGLMYLSDLLQSIITLPTAADRQFTGLSIDTRQLQPGNIFIALSGTQTSGALYIDQAVAKQACAVLVERSKYFASISYQQQVVIIPIPNLAHHLGELAARFYHYPSKSLQIIGVTGTNGKTSCTHYLAQSLQYLNKPCGLIGTLGSGLYGQLKFTGMTTPDAITLQHELELLRDIGAKTIAMEVSSHSIAQERINSLEFEVGMFTNLTQDHLDYHGDMATYAEVKRSFLASKAVKQLVINVDDQYGRKWAQTLKKDKPVYTYSVTDSGAQHNNHVYVKNVQLNLNGIQAELYSPWGISPISLPLIGQFNLSNALAVFTGLCVIDTPFADAISSINVLKPVDGRMQVLGGNKMQPLVIVDYAHTPDALEKVLSALHHHKKGKLYCVFGCGGERDKAKRPLMAKIASRWADHIYVTNDNPRREKPESIIADIMHGFNSREAVTVEFDRSHAIANSIQSATIQDCILIAGKGAEAYQQVGEDKVPFSDVAEVSKNLALYFPFEKNTGERNATVVK